MLSETTTTVEKVRLKKPFVLSAAVVLKFHKNGREH
jgi:hypothetical protein